MSRSEGYGSGHWSFLFLVVLLPLYLCSGCVPPSTGTTSLAPPVREVFPAEQALQAADFAPAIAELNKQIDKKGISGKEKALVRLDLAALQLDARNPKRNYGAANSNLQKAVAGWPQLQKRAGVQNWSEVLARQSRLAEQLKTLQATMLKEKGVNQDLHSEISKLQATLERLKKLDANLEKKRRAYR